MKAKLTSLAFLLLLCPILVSAQASPFDTINRDEVEIGGAITYGDSAGDLTSAFGDPEHTRDYYLEMDKKTEVQYIYADGSEFRFIDDKLHSFKIASPDYTLSLGEAQLQIGDSLASVASSFPNSRSYMENDATAMIIGLGTGDHDVLLVVFDAEETVCEIRQHTF
ncbi:hypothetical protein CRI93_06350 [Longimonas halophila]|uniref:Uncharacterized protein n=1 Tax=Longimonas halophila TaxID=1469170 RepID=A0A2H3NLV5_9BACT|nr:hypothetical protein [Longimonas halophila]PEN07598.1 hypothetical protein CRI93_06350 [Longimonas halophila]